MSFPRPETSITRSDDDVSTVHTYPVTVCVNRDRPSQSWEPSQADQIQIIDHTFDESEWTMLVTGLTLLWSLSPLLHSEAVIVTIAWAVMPDSSWNDWLSETEQKTELVLWMLKSIMAYISLFTILLIKTSMPQAILADNNFLTGKMRMIHLLWLVGIQSQNKSPRFLATIGCQLWHLISLFPGSNDIVAVIGEDGDFRASPFSVQFGKMKRWCHIQLSMRIIS